MVGKTKQKSAKKKPAEKKPAEKKPAEKKPAEKKPARHQTTAEKVAGQYRRDARELRESADRQERDKELCQKEPRFLQAIRAKRKMANELEAKADSLTR